MAERIFIHEETENKVTAINDIQAAAYLNEGFKEVEEEKPKKGKDKEKE